MVKTFNFNNNEYSIELEKYSINDATCIILSPMNNDQEDEIILSINIEASSCLNESWFFVREYGSEIKIANILEQKGIIRELDIREQQGYGTYRAFALIPESFDYVSINNSNATKKSSLIAKEFVNGILLEDYKNNPEALSDKYKNYLIKDGKISTENINLEQNKEVSNCPPFEFDEVE